MKHFNPSSGVAVTLLLGFKIPNDITKQTII
jgi:hypothetical protein